MVKIPRYESTATITSISPIKRVSAGMFTASSQEMQLVGQTIEKTAKIFEEAQTLYETTRADTQARRKLKEIELEAEQSEDVFDIKTYQDKIKKAGEEASKGITLPAARSKFQQTYGRLAAVSDFTVRSTLRKRQVDAMRAEMLENIAAMQDSATRESDLNLLMADSIRNRIISKEDAFKLKETTRKKWRNADVRVAIYNDADNAKRNLLAGEFGELTADETAKWLEVADKKIKRNKKEADKRRDEKWLANSGEVIAKLDQISTEDLIQLMANNAIHPKVAKDLINWKLDPDSVQYETDKQVWLEIVRDSVSPEQDLRLFQQRIAEAIADKKIQANDGANLANKVKELFTKAIEFKSQPNTLDQLKATAMDAFFASTFPPAAVYRMTQRFFDKAKEGMTDDEGAALVRELINSEMRSEYPETAALEGIPNSVTDREGNLRSIATGKTKLTPNLAYTKEEIPQEQVKQFLEQLEEGEILILRGNKIMAVMEDETENGDVRLNGESTGDNRPR